MSGLVSTAINSFSAMRATPEKLHNFGRAFGLLSDIQPAEDCQLARIGKRLIVLPQDLDLSGHIGHRIGLILADGQHLIRRL